MHQPCSWCTYAVLVRISPGYPPVPGMSLTRYAPLRRSPPESIAAPRAAPRLACVRPAASVHPEPGSNSSLYITFLSFLSLRFYYHLSGFPDGIDARTFFGTFSCLLPVFSMNFLFLFFPLLSASPVPFPAPLSLSRAPRSERDCKGTAFFFISNFFSNFFLFFFDQENAHAAQPTGKHVDTQKIFRRKNLEENHCADKNSIHAPK